MRILRSLSITATIMAVSFLGPTNAVPASPLQQTGQNSNQPGEPSRNSDVPLPDGDGKALTQKTCSGCHSTDVFARQRHDEEKWNQIIDNMTSKGLTASDDDLDKIAKYLATFLGPNSPPVPGAQDASPKTAPQTSSAPN
jgi:cytochrome c5